MKTIFFLVTLLCVQLSFAQTARTIEVKVKDTVELKVLTATLNLSVGHDYSEYYDDAYYDDYDGYEEYDDYDYEAEYYNNLSRKEKREHKKMERKIQKDFKEMDKYLEETETISELPYVPEVDTSFAEPMFDEYHYETFDERKAKWLNFLTVNQIVFDTTVSFYNEYSEYGSFSIQLANINLAKMNLVYQFIDSVENSYIKVDKINYESIDSKMNEETYGKLYKKAQIQANALAKTLGSSVTRVVRVYEPNAEFLDLEEMYSSILNNTLNGDGSNKAPESKNFKVQKVFVFEIK
jgi:hypothetical protein